MRDRLKLARLVALLTPCAALGGALAFQYLGGLYPCEMCLWQRYAHAGALALALVAMALPAARWPLGLSALALALAALIGGYHAGVEYGWWMGLTGCTSTVKFTGGDPVAAVLAAPLVRCDVVQWQMFGVSLAGFDFLLSGAAAVAILALLGRSAKR